MIIVNLQQLGPVAPFFVNRANLAIVKETADEILADTPESVMDEILDEWETGLTWRACSAEPVGEDWYLRALLLVCCRGLRGESAPQFYFLGEDN
jgi:hypothetical protein